jgi:cytoskeletal protein CcmA (bactofilin family)
MLGSKKSSTRGSGGTTLISQDTVVVGDLRFKGNLEVEGLVQGNIIAVSEKNARIRVVGKGCVEGEIRAPYVVINGLVKGDVYCSKQLELASKGCVNGNVFYAMVEMSAGAEVNGSLTHVEEAPPIDKTQVPSKAD